MHLFIKYRLDNSSILYTFSLLYLLINLILRFIKVQYPNLCYSGQVVHHYCNINIPHHFRENVVKLLYTLDLNEDLILKWQCFALYVFGTVFFFGNWQIVLCGVFILQYLEELYQLIRWLMCLINHLKLLNVMWVFFCHLLQCIIKRKGL